MSSITFLIHKVPHVGAISGYVSRCQADNIFSSQMQGPEDRAPDGSERPGPGPAAKIRS